MIRGTPFTVRAKLVAFSQVARFLDDCELQDYIDEAGWWDQRIEPLEPTAIQATDTVDATSVAPGAFKGLKEVGRLDSIGRFAEYNQGASRGWYGASRDWWQW